MVRNLLGVLILTGLCTSCQPTPTMTTFGDDLAFLREHVATVVLTDPTSRVKVAVVPQWQGRVMTSTAQGDAGMGYGWINRSLIESAVVEDQINAFGGEDRFWLGPEGGQFSVYFAPGVPFEFANWFVPAEIDTEPFDVVHIRADEVALIKAMELTNFSGTDFHIQVRRTVRILENQLVETLLGTSVGGLDLAAFESVNTVTNTGEEAWDAETGLLSIWILGMFTPSPTTTVAVPFNPAAEGPIVNDAYFGEVPEDRLVVRDSVVYFRADGQYRSKIGFTWARSKPVAGSFDASAGVLTIVQFNRPNEPMPYVNSMWEIQDEPYAGDVVNSYNDGPPEPGLPPLGPFYELETSSPVEPLQPDESLTHIHRTIHLVGDESALNRVALHVLGCDLETIRGVFGQ